MKTKKTKRGFDIINFKDSYKTKCSIQQSSVGTHIWLGSSDLIVNVGYPWREVSKEELKTKFNAKEILGNNRIHLNQKQVAKLIPILQKFVDTGEIS